MQDNIGRTGSNWTGRTPRSTQEAGFFSQYPDSSYTEPTPAKKIGDYIAIAAMVGVFGVFTLWGGIFFGAL